MKDKFKKTVSLVKEYQWDSHKNEEEALEIAKRIYHIFVGRIPQDKFTKRKCQLSSYGVETFGKQRMGIVVGESRNGKNWIVKWEGNKTTSIYHKDFIVFTLPTH